MLLTNRINPIEIIERKQAPNSPGVYAISGIYTSEETKFNSIYIGSTVNLKNRIFDNHIPAIKSDNHSNIKIQNYYNKYGENCFKLFILENVDDNKKDSLLIEEQKWIDFYRSVPDINLFNIVLDVINHTCEVETRQKMSETRKKQQRWKGENNPFYGIKRMGAENPFFGQKHSEETRKLISDIRYKTIEQKGSWWLGKKHSQEAKEKIRIFRTGKRQTEKTKEKLRQINKSKNIDYSHQMKPVKQINRISGEIIKIWPSAISVKRELKIDNSSIMKCCSKYLSKGQHPALQAGGYKWEYCSKEEYEAYINNLTN